MSTAPSLHCPHCNQQMQYIAELAGQDASCPSCKQIFNVPVIEVTPQTMHTPPNAATPFGNNGPGLKSLPPQYAHLHKNAKGVHNRKIFWLCMLAAIPTILWIVIITLDIMINH